MGDGQFILESLAGHDAIGHVVDEHKLHRLAGLDRTGHDLDLCALAWRPTEIGGAEHWKQVRIRARRSPFLFLNPFGPPQALVARVISEDRQFQIWAAHAGPEMKVGGTSRSIPQAIVCDSGLSARQDRSQSEVAGAAIKQSPPIHIVSRWDRSVGKIQRMTGESARVHGHRLVELHRKRPYDFELVRRYRRTWLVADSAEIEDALMFEARDQDRFRTRRAKDRVAAALWRLSLRGAVGEQE